MPAPNELPIFMKYLGFEFTVQDAKDLLKEGVSSSFVQDLRRRNKKHKIGIVVGITTEENDERNRVDNDLIKEINNVLNSKNLAGLFNIIKLDNEESKKIDNQNWLKKLEKLEAHLIIYGSVYKRNAETGYSLKLDAGVRHEPIPAIVSNILSNDFASIFPRQRFIPKANDLLGFEITAKEIGLIAQYMVGVALFVSGYLGPSFIILTSLKEKIDSITTKEIHTLDQLRDRTKDRIVDVSINICFYLYNLYSLERNIDFIKDSKSYIDIVNRDRPLSNSVKHLESIYYFLVDNNIDKAISTLLSFDDPLKPYNLGFLYFFKEDIAQGLRYYKKAFKRDISGKTANELEIFVSDILEKYPEKHQLLFARALINYKIRGDFKLALDDFKIFINKVSSKHEYPELIRLSEIHLQEIHKKK